MENKINRDKVVFINLTEMDKYNGLEENTHGGGTYVSSKMDMVTRFLTSVTTMASAMDIHLLTGNSICPAYRE